jgi:hypothetical protein
MARRSPFLGGRFHAAIRSNPDGSVAESEPRDHLAAVDAPAVRFAQFTFVP